MHIRIRSVLILALISQAAVLPSFAQTTSRLPLHTTAEAISAEAFEKATFLTYKITINPGALMVLSLMLEDMRIVDPTIAASRGLYDLPNDPRVNPKELGGERNRLGLQNNRVATLTNSQIMEMLIGLSNALPSPIYKELWDDLEALPEQVDQISLQNNLKASNKDGAEKILKIAAASNSTFQRLMKNLTTLGPKKLAVAFAPHRPFAVNIKGGKIIQPGYEAMRTYVNHTIINPKELLQKSGSKLVPRTMTDEEFSEQCKKIDPSEALKDPSYMPGTDFALSCKKKDFLLPGTNLVKVLTAFINGVSELKGAAAFEQVDKIEEDLKDLDLEKGAANEVWFNVFEFNLQEVKDAFINNHKGNLDTYLKNAANDSSFFKNPVPKLRGGIDYAYILTEKGTHPSEAVIAVYNEFQAYAKQVIARIPKNAPEDVKKQMREAVQVFAVRSPSLNHQKVVVRDPSDPKKAAVLFLSGNFTDSCLNAFGDASVKKLKESAIKGRNGRLLDELEDALPNANHAIILKGYIPAQLTRLELMKFLRPDHKKSKDAMPIVGSYRIYGNSQSYVDLTFSVNGGMGNPEKHGLVPMIQEEALRVAKGKASSGGAFIESAHFVMSSPAVERAMLRLAALSKNVAGDFTYRFVGDSPFALREYSLIQKFSCVTRKMKGPGRPDKRYFDMSQQLPVSDQPYMQLCPAVTKIPYNVSGTSGSAAPIDKDNIEKVRSDLRLAPLAYKKHFLNAGGQKYEYEGKIHHKLLLLPHLNLATIGSSLNLSSSANSNHEQLLIVKDAEAVGMMRGAISFMHLMSKVSRAGKPVPKECKEQDGSVFCGAMERNLLAEIATLRRECGPSNLKTLSGRTLKEKLEECEALNNPDPVDNEEDETGSLIRG